MIRMEDVPLSQQTTNQSRQPGDGDTKTAERNVREPGSAPMPDDNNIPLGGSTARIGAVEEKDDDGAPPPR
jgi:hypothetical protein